MKARGKGFSGSAGQIATTTTVRPVRTVIAASNAVDAKEKLSCQDGCEKPRSPERSTERADGELNCGERCTRRCERERVQSFLDVKKKV